MTAPDSPNARKSREEIAQAYKSEPWWYDVRGFFILTFAYNSSLPAQMRLFGPNFGPKHLEVACGTGTLLELFLRWRRWKKLPEVDIVGVDYAEPMLAGARHRFKGQAGLKFLHADVAEMPFESASFDTANVANAVHCFPDVDGGFRDVLRVLKPGGMMAANVLLFPRGSGALKAVAERINAWGIRKGILYTPYERADVRQRVLAAGFEIVRDDVSGNCYNVLARRPLA
ncbi:MAG: class I SAM-dependent methyltransferase [Pseudomonadota bacterium]|nr:class I SAM-dependent methyltransferase [Pseudomonadota bacterium]